MTLEGKYLERFLSRIVKSDGCWEWRGAHTSAGYSETYDGERPLYAHRVAYALWVAPIPQGYEIDHVSCDNPGCLNPDHLRAVPPRANNMRSGSAAAVNARKTHCPQGHAYDEENTHLDPRGRRVCKACWKIKGKKQWAKEKASRPSRAAKDRTHCPQGHPYDAENTLVVKGKSGRPTRQCRTCNRERERRLRQRRREEAKARQ